MAINFRPGVPITRPGAITRPPTALPNVATPNDPRAGVGSMMGNLPTRTGRRFLRGNRGGGNRL